MSRDKLKLIAETYLFPSFVLVVTVFLLYQYFVTGVYKWHVVQGGNKISVAYAMLVFLGVYYLKLNRLKYPVLAGLILLYSIFTGVTGSLLIAIYFSITYYLLGIRYYKSGLAVQLSYGVLFFLLIRSVLSITSANLILNEIIFLVMVATICFCTVGTKESIAGIIHKTSLSINKKLVFIVFALMTVGLNIGSLKYGHDSLWYPLRSHVLYFYNGFFSDNGFYGQVHYYPKLWESITNNIFIQYNYSFASSIGLSLYMVLAVIIYSLFEKNKVTNTLIVITMPVVLGLSFTLKTDFLLLFLFLVAFMAVERNRYDLLISVLLLSLCVKNTAVVFILSMIAYLYVRNKRNVEKIEYNHFNYIIVLITSLVFCLFLYRTYLLTGVLVASPSSLIGIQELLGFNLEIPERIARGTGNSLFDIYKMVFFPEELAHHRFFYNGYLWVASVFVLDVFIVIFLLPVLLVAYTVVNVGDGNYYVVATVVLTVFALRKINVHKVAFLIIFSNIIISIVANPNWVVPKKTSTKNICKTVVCSDEKSIIKTALQRKLGGLMGVINDSSKKYFVVSKDDNKTIWKLFHRYDVAHIREFNVWNKIVPMYHLQEYIDKFVDVLIVENNFGYEGDVTGFEVFKDDEKYTYYKKIDASS